MSWFMSVIYDSFMRKSEEACLDEWRRELLADVKGDVLEVGAGTGANLAHYGPSVARLALTEPDRHMFGRLRKRADASGREVELQSAPAHALPFDASRFDVVVCTLVLCSVEDPARTLREIRRVLKPGGSFVFLEHVASDNPGRFAWQRRVEPFWRPISGNCHLTRRTEEAIVTADFTLDRVRRESMRKALPIVRPTVRGVARKS